MSSTLTAHIGDLAESLQDLRRRFRQAARYEVARAIAEALRDAAMAIVCGPAPMPGMPRQGSSAWEDPWQDPLDPPWQVSASPVDVIDADERDSRSTFRVSPAVLAGMGAARWSFTRSRQVAPALLIGLLVALAATIGGPTVMALLRAWTVANDLLSHTATEQEL